MNSTEVELRSHFLTFTAIPVALWIFGVWRGWAWTICPQCTFWVCSADQDLTIVDFEHRYRDH